MKKIFLTALLAPIMLWSCQSDTTQRSDGLGSITVSEAKGVEIEPNVITRAAADVEQFTLNVVEESSQAVIATGLLAEFPGGVVDNIPAGTYTVTLTSHPDGFTPAFEDAMYEAVESGVDVAANSNTRIKLEATQANAGVYFVYDESLYTVGNYSDVVPTITQGDAALVCEGANHEARGYFNPEEAILTIKDGNDLLTIGGETWQSLNLDREQLWEITLKVTGSGSLSIEASVKVITDPNNFEEFEIGTAASPDGVYFIAPDGDDRNTGTIDSPFASLNHALSLVQPGETIYLRGGTYYMTNDDITREDNTWVYVFDISTAGGKVSGTADAPINIWGYEGERPVLDMSQVRPEPVKRVIVFYVDRSYYHFKNFEIVGTQVVVTGHTQSECFRNDGGNYNIYENLSMHDGMAIGFYLTRGMYNLVLNCDAYNNYDDFSEGAYGGNVDGFGAHVPNANHVGNVFRGCRAWWNSDDGFDLINCFAPVIFENCWAFYNGYQPGTMANAGDGSGFKAGGYGLSGVVTIDVVPMHTVRGCLAYYNLNQGFYSNHHLGGIEFYNNTAMANPSNFNMLNRDAPENVYDRPEGYGHIIKNNVSYQPRREGQHLINIDFDECEVGINSFYPVEMDLTDADFVSLDPSELMAPRKADGSLPDINFLRPAPGSQLIGAGEYLGFDFTGTNLGCYQ